MNQDSRQSVDIEVNGGVRCREGFEDVDDYGCNSILFGNRLESFIARVVGVGTYETPHTTWNHGDVIRVDVEGACQSCKDTLSTNTINVGERLITVCDACLGGEMAVDTEPPRNGIRCEACWSLMGSIGELLEHVAGNPDHKVYTHSNGACQSCKDTLSTNTINVGERLITVCDACLGGEMVVDTEPPRNGIRCEACWSLMGSIGELLEHVAGNPTHKVYTHSNGASVAFTDVVTDLCSLCEFYAKEPRNRIGHGSVEACDACVDEYIVEKHSPCDAE